MNHETWDHVPAGLKQLVDLVSIGTMLGSLFQLLPSLAALLTVIWTAIRIYETQTVRGWMGKKGGDHAAD